MRPASIVRRLTLALILTGATAGLDAAQAMPAAPALAGAADGAGLTAVQYMRYPNYRYRRFNRHRRAGLYDCGPNGVSTHLARKACR